MLVRAQAVVALALPWLAAYVLLPGSTWVPLVALVPLLFAVLHARAWQAWAAPVSGVISVVPFVPWWGSAVVAVAAGVLLMLRPPAQAPLPATHSRVWLLGASGLLVAAGLALATMALVDVRERDAAFDEAQALAAETWITDDQADDTPDAQGTQDSAGLVGEPMQVQQEAAEPVRPAFAKLRFVRQGTDEPVVIDRVLYVGPDVTDRGLAAGPGHYPATSRPGKSGNVAIAGHRTGWGSPFLHLDDLQPGDRIKLVDRKGVRHTYVVRESQLVAPTADWVLGPDPLGTGEPTLTLTTCDPPEVNSERLIVFATLVKSVPLAQV